MPPSWIRPRCWAECDSGSASGSSWFTSHVGTLYDTALGATLREFGVDTVVVAGANYPNCPRATLYGASERDYRAVAVGDAISGWTPVAAGELAGLGIATIAAAELTAAVAGAAESGPPPAEIDAEGGSIGI